MADRQSFHSWIRPQTRLLAKIYGNKNQGTRGRKGLKMLYGDTASEKLLLP
ncbi:hypothetical protein [Methanosarcina mazei]|uniref:hypothetical protein n=1 Tax=Methanosarcina mazei TaxID=2209 RepID=UPI000AB2CA98|nr:hypothetical protein [Methanosarcina mazei]